jgi:hypothetical protein
MVCTREEEENDFVDSVFEREVHMKELHHAKTFLEKTTDGRGL